MLWLLRHRLTEIITLAIRRIEGASDIEIGAVKIKGAIVSQQGDVLRGDTNELTLVDATLKLFDDRHNVYKEFKYLHVVHTIKPSEPKEYVENLRVFDVSVYIAPHRNLGKLNDVSQVRYYFGHKWGKGKYGSMYVVESANDNFALTAKMYGACMCIAVIEFHDGSKCETSKISRRRNGSYIWSAFTRSAHRKLSN